MDEKELQEYLHNMGQKERRELTARLRLVKPKRKKAYKQNISEQQRLQLEAELSSRGVDGCESEIDLLLRGGSIPSGGGYVFFTATTVCRKMTNGVSGTDAAALTIRALLTGVSLSN